MSSGAEHGVAVRCWTCGKIHDVRALSATMDPNRQGHVLEPLAPCCFDTLSDVANAFSRAVLRQLPFNVDRMVEKQMEFNDAVADAAILSPNPAVRKAAQEWRNARAARKSEGSS